MRIALASTGLGKIRRGFEAFTESLFQALRQQSPELDVTLFQGGGWPQDHRVVVPNFHRANIPARWFERLTASHWEKRSFALALYPRLRIGDYDIVHYNELTMGSALFHLRRLFGGKFKLLYCNGAPSPPLHYHHRCDFAQVLTPPDQELALAFGVPETRLFSIPYGIDANLFHPDRKLTRSIVRAEIGIPADAQLVLSVAAVKREHKRIDYLIEETAKLGADAWLVVAGQRTDDTPFLESLAERLMPGRWRFVSWPHQRVAELLGAADVFALCSLTEAFGLVTIEAVLSEIPVVTHDGPVFQWLAEGTTSHVIDMAKAGLLAETLGMVLTQEVTLHKDLMLRDSRNTALRRFSWQEMAPRYLEMYREVLDR
jgi:glycosyltransferase involved in cell wall biosynthesis